MSADILAIALAHIAADEADLRAELVVWTEMAKQAITELHDEKQQHKSLREQHHRLLDEYRALRVQVMGRAVAA